MFDWISLIESGNLVTLIIAVLLALVTGGVGVAIVNSVSASRRGIKGDALVKEQNGIAGMTALSNIQDNVIRRTLEDAANAAENSRKEIQELKDELQELREEVRREIGYSNLLIAQLVSNGIPPQSRPSS